MKCIFGVLPAALLALAGQAVAGIWPETIGQYVRKEAFPATPVDAALWEEYGFLEAEQARYQSESGRKLAVTAFRLNDSTGALALYQSLLPADARPSRMAEVSAQTQFSLLAVHGNYVLRFEGRHPDRNEWKEIKAALPGLSEAPLPVLPGYLPAARRVLNSERYVLGPTSLQRFAPSISAEAVGFGFGPEGQASRFQTRKGAVDLVLFSYPNPQIARERLKAFEALPGVQARRTGSLVAALTGGAANPEAQKILNSVNHQVSVVWNEAVPGKAENVGDMLIAIFTLTGLLLALCLGAGLTMAALRLTTRRMFGRKGADEPMILLHLEDR